ncbi:MAG TPA: hypothetical protein VMH37_16205 [Candidatus Binataceae bacterium]|nr:hypothetical protein [Candidatus Binataceae bacterium]
MYRRDPIDSLLTFCGIIALGALLLTVLVKFGHFNQRIFMSRTFVSEQHAFDFKHLWHGHVDAIGGPLDVKGPLRVHGNLYVGGPATVHGLVQAQTRIVGGPIQTSLPKGEQPGPDGQAYNKSLAVGGPLTVQGSLIVDGRLVVGGPLNSEPGQE